MLASQKPDTSPPAEGADLLIKEKRNCYIDRLEGPSERRGLEFVTNALFLYI